MIINAGTEIGKNTEVRCQDGHTLSHIMEFNTVTKEAVIFANLFYNDNKTRPALKGIGYNRDIVTFNCHLPFHKAYNIKTGEEII